MKKTLLILALTLLTTGLFAQYPATVSVLYALDSIQIGDLVPDETQPTFAIRADADSDAADVTEILNLQLTPNADPTLAIWNFVSTQSAGYGFDKTVKITQGSARYGIDIDQNGNQNALFIDSESANNPAIETNAKFGIFSYQDLADGYGLRVYRDNATAEINPLAYFVNENTTNEQPTVFVDHDGTGGATGYPLHIDSENAAAAALKISSPFAEIELSNGAVLQNTDTDTILVSEDNFKIDGDLILSESWLVIQTNSDANIVPDGTGVINVSGTTNYEDNVTGDDDIPNKKYVDDAIGVAYSSLWFHEKAVATVITTQNTFTKIEIFDNVGNEDASGNVVGDATDNDFTINLAGVYDINLQASITNAGGGAVEFHLGVRIILNTAKTITDATNATPIVITSEGHGLKTGDGVTQSGVITNTNANGDFSIIRLSADTYSIHDLAHVDIAGNGAYGGGGSVTSTYPGNIYMERIVSNTQLGRGACSGTYLLAVDDILEAIAVNQDGTDNLATEQIQFGVCKIN